MTECLINTASQQVILRRQKMEGGRWKAYKAACEYCGSTNCDMMEFWEELTYDYDSMYRDDKKEKKEKRKYMYRSYIFQKYGPLRKGDSKKV